MSNQFIQTNAVINSLADQAQTISAADSGKTILLTTITAARVYTLPALQAGLYYRFVVNTASAFSHTITSAAANIKTACILNATATNLALTATICMGATGAATTIGDRLELYCTGSNWIGFGFGAIAASIAVAPS